ncbi:Pancreatic triacylglycerol lipase [Portunus trituberculatus]|uniref:Pancreatic triacylglycerol lipase n=1 Tax=Portunus trituberculatus TaxID=210409 RepID=A0A5B7FIK1_PORTR|nr:Pancreatic triacylglycerol lipase [Portunus trituberculatus]
MVSTLLLLLLVGAMVTVTAAPQHELRASLDDVRFLLWTRSNSGDSECLDLIKGDLYSLGHFNGHDPTVVLIHGFSSHGYSGWPVHSKTGALSSLRRVGKLTAQLLDWLHEAGGMQPAGVQIVGHSLGAHVAGVIGQNLKNFRLPFITGMDPAGPDFYNMPESSRLDKTDADFVQIIHTNGGGVAEVSGPTGRVNEYRA